MKLGFLDVASNKFNGFEAAARECEQQANVVLEKMTASEHLKIPVCAKKLFTEQGVDVVLAFVQANLEEDKDILMLVQEKTIDVEIATNKFVFFCVVLDEEWRSAEQLRAVAEQKIAAAVLEIVSTMREHQSTASQSPEFSSALGMFASNDYASSQQSSQSQSSQSSYQDSYYPSQQSTQSQPEEKEKEHGLFEVEEESEEETEEIQRPLF